MDFPIDVRPSGAVRLGPDVACDGFIDGVAVRVQTHVHKDHMEGFETSKGLHKIVLSDATRELLVAERNADLPYRSNLIPLGESEPYKIRGSEVSLTPSGHMLGAMQVAVQLDDGRRLGYSGDFQWPLERAIEVDALVVDSTYAAPGSRRRYTQGECEERFAAILRRLLSSGPVILKAHRGTLQRGLQVIAGEIGCPVIGNEMLMKEVHVYRKFGYTIGQVHSKSSDEARHIRESGRYIEAFGRWESLPTDIGERSQVTLTAFFTKPDEPVIEYSERAFAVAMSDHADFSGTIEYVSATGARFVVTDNTRGRGQELALAIRQRLGIAAKPSSNLPDRRWGR